MIWVAGGQFIQQEFIYRNFLETFRLRRFRLPGLLYEEYILGVGDMTLMVIVSAFKFSYTLIFSSNFEFYF